MLGAVADLLHFGVSSPLLTLARRVRMEGRPRSNGDDADRCPMPTIMSSNISI
jgi:hypothetical protein